MTSKALKPQALPMQKVTRLLMQMNSSRLSSLQLQLQLQFQVQLLAQLFNFTRFNKTEKEIDDENPF